MTIGVRKPRKLTLNTSPNRRWQDSRNEIGRSSQRRVCTSGGSRGPAGSALTDVEVAAVTIAGGGGGPAGPTSAGGRPGGGAAGRPRAAPAPYGAGERRGGG